MYRSAYSDEALDHYAQQIAGEAERGTPTWCMFDNTAGSEATGNALDLVDRLSGSAPPIDAARRVLSASRP
jgi:uncharacterized protein YecE (DUF72 family)